MFIIYCYIGLGGEAGYNISMYVPVLVIIYIFLCLNKHIGYIYTLKKKKNWKEIYQNVNSRFTFFFVFFYVMSFLNACILIF